MGVSPHLEEGESNTWLQCGWSPRFGLMFITFLLVDGSLWRVEAGLLACGLDTDLSQQWAFHTLQLFPITSDCSHRVASNLLGVLCDRWALGWRQFSREGGEVGYLEIGKWWTLAIVLHPTGSFWCQQSGPQLQSYFGASECYWFGLRYWALYNLHHKEYAECQPSLFCCLLKGTW